jgi:antitoxin Phd
MSERTWSLAEAKARFSEVVERARAEGPQHVTRHGRRTVVVVSEDAWHRLVRAQGTFVQALLNPSAQVLSDEEADRLFARDPDAGRPVEF